eukprot:7420953-Pyramimonas_sp.AAC.1
MSMFSRPSMVMHFETVHDPEETHPPLMKGVNSAAEGVNSSVEGVNSSVEGVNSSAEGVNSEVPSGPNETLACLWLQSEQQ